MGSLLVCAFMYVGEEGVGEIDAYHMNYMSGCRTCIFMRVERDGWINIYMHDSM